MDRIEMCKHALIDAVYESDIYKEYQVCAAVLRAQPEKMARVNAFREKSLIYQQTQADTAHEMLDELVAEKAQIRADVQISAYLDAELALCRLLQGLCLDIAGIADLHLTENVEDALW